MAQRGSYAKGVAKREEILERALDVVAREGLRGASVKMIADAVGLSQAGLLHYFDSKEELFTAILRKRDELDAAAYGPFDDPHGSLDDVAEGFLHVVRHNAEVPGLVQLFAQLSVDAADHTHPAHDWFLERSRRMREGTAAAFAASQERGAATPALSPEAFARVLQAVSDGLQIQWMQEPDLDMAGVISQLLAALAPTSVDAASADADSSDQAASR